MWGLMPPFLMPDAEQHFNADDTIRVCIENKCMTVSSMHLVPDAEARLRRILAGEIPNLKEWEAAQ
jgi:hypothetical protein